MRTLLVTTLIALPLTAGSASAQYGTVPVPNWGPGYRGNISPYLDISRNNNFNNNNFINPGLNYFLGTRSEQQRRANAFEFRSELEAQPGLIRDAEDRAVDRVLIQSGVSPVRVKYFDNTGTYFPARARSGGVSP